MNEALILEEINDFIIMEEGEAVEADNLLIDSGADSFGLTMVIVSIDDKYSIWTQEELDNLDIPTLTIQMIIDKIKENV